MYQRTHTVTDTMKTYGQKEEAQTTNAHKDRQHLRQNDITHERTEP